MTADTAKPSRLQLFHKGQFKAAPESGYRIVRMDRLTPNPRNERKTFRGMDGLVESIRAVGVLEPLIVEPLEGGRFTIVIGERRYRAAMEAGLEKVPVLVSAPGKGMERQRKSIVSNVQREDVSPVELAQGLQALMDEDEAVKTQADLAKLIGKRKEWVSGMLRVLTLPTEILKKVGSTQLSTSYDVMIRIARLEDAEHQNRLIESVLDGATQREVREEISKIKGSHGSSTAAPKRAPRQVYTTSHQMTIIAQSHTDAIAPGQIVAALTEALELAKGEP